MYLGFRHKTDKSVEKLVTSLVAAVYSQHLQAPTNTYKHLQTATLSFLPAATLLGAVLLPIYISRDRIGTHLSTIASKIYTKLTSKPSPSAEEMAYNTGGIYGFSGFPAFTSSNGFGAPRASPHVTTGFGGNFLGNSRSHFPTGGPAEPSNTATNTNTNINTNTNTIFGNSAPTLTRVQQLEKENRKLRAQVAQNEGLAGQQPRQTSAGLGVGGGHNTTRFGVGDGFFNGNGNNGYGIPAANVTSTTIPVPRTTLNKAKWVNNPSKFDPSTTTTATNHGRTFGTHIPTNGAFSSNSRNFMNANTAIPDYEKDGYVYDVGANFGTGGIQGSRAFMSGAIQTPKTATPTAPQSSFLDSNTSVVPRASFFGSYLSLTHIHGFAHVRSYSPPSYASPLPTFIIQSAPPRPSNRLPTIGNSRLSRLNSLTGTITNELVALSTRWAAEAKHVDDLLQNTNADHAGFRCDIDSFKLGPILRAEEIFSDLSFLECVQIQLSETAGEEYAGTTLKRLSLFEIHTLMYLRLHDERMDWLSGLLRFINNITVYFRDNQYNNKDDLMSDLLDRLIPEFRDLTANLDLAMGLTHTRRKEVVNALERTHAPTVRGVVGRKLADWEYELGYVTSRFNIVPDQAQFTPQQLEVKTLGDLMLQLLESYSDVVRNL